MGCAGRRHGSGPSVPAGRGRRGPRPAPSICWLDGGTGLFWPLSLESGNDASQTPENSVIWSVFKSRSRSLVYVIISAWKIQINSRLALLQMAQISTSKGPGDDDSST